MVEAGVAAAEALAAEGHFDAATTSRAAEGLGKQRAGLLHVAQVRSAGLEERRQWHQYQLDTRDSIEWMQERVVLASSTEIGSDQESCEVHLKAFRDLAKGAEVAAPGRRRSVAAALEIAIVLRAEVSAVLPRLRGLRHQTIRGPHMMRARNK